jgi:hypothetical protein
VTEQLDSCPRFVALRYLTKKLDEVAVLQHRLEMSVAKTLLSNVHDQQLAQVIDGRASKQLRLLAAAVILQNAATTLELGSNLAADQGCS